MLDHEVTARGWKQHTKNEGIEWVPEDRGATAPGLGCLPLCCFVCTAITRYAFLLVGVFYYTQSDLVLSDI